MVVTVSEKTELENYTKRNPPYTKEQLLHDLNIVLEDEKGWMEKYKSLEEVPEENDDIRTEGMIEGLKLAINLIKHLEEAHEKNRNNLNL